MDSHVRFVDWCDRTITGLILTDSFNLLRWPSTRNEMAIESSPSITTSSKPAQSSSLMRSKMLRADLSPDPSQSPSTLTENGFWKSSSTGCISEIGSGHVVGVALVLPLTNMTMIANRPRLRYRLCRSSASRISTKSWSCWQTLRHFSAKT